MATEVLQLDKQVIVEKPMALSLADVDRMLVAAKTAGRKLCVVRQNRYNPPMQDLRRVEDEGRLGLTRYFDFYAHQRPHQALGYRTPAQVYFGKA